MKVSDRDRNVNRKLVLVVFLVRVIITYSLKYFLLYSHSERDGLASELARLNVHVQQLVAREADAYQQVKACIELAEQSQMDMAQVSVCLSVCLSLELHLSLFIILMSTATYKKFSVIVE